MMLLLAIGRDTQTKSAFHLEGSDIGKYVGKALSAPRAMNGPEGCIGANALVKDHSDPFQFA